MIADQDFTQEVAAIAATRGFELRAAQMPSTTIRHEEGRGFAFVPCLWMADIQCGIGFSDANLPLDAVKSLSSILGCSPPIDIGPNTSLQLLSRK